jgi:hypothetical protein
MYLANEDASNGFCKYEYITVPSKKGEEFVNKMSS